MAKTDWTMLDTIKPEDLNAIGAEINAAREHTDQKVQAITPESIGAETPSGAQAKANQAEANAKEYANKKVASIHVPVKSVNNKTGDVRLTAADVGAETPSGAQAKANQAEANAKEYANKKVASIHVPVKSVNNKTGD
ncbi:hypothetical protein PPOP_1622, partial [Paenibacillus popilliae ATCC 14706]